ncbi:transcription termination/antitermination protein NusA [Patescibacteria group bacterium]|nr:transcription termination/antitermination protein NusA [Patescibacteria group bacterium]
MSDITNAMRQLCEDKGLSFEVVLETIESALSAAYRKDFGSKNQNIKVNFDPETAKSEVFDVKIVVEDLPDEQLEETEEEIIEGEKNEKEIIRQLVKEQIFDTHVITDENGVRKFNPKNNIQLKDALLLDPKAKIDDEIKIELEPPSEYGRMAAQTAKQVIIQKIREAERNMVLADFKEKEGEVLIGIIQRQEGRFVLVDLEKSVGILTNEEQIPGEVYKPGARIKVFIKEVRDGIRGPEISLSRKSTEIIRHVFQMEIPEIGNGLIEIKSIAREAGSRSKVAIQPLTDNIDPIGSCVGQRGSRIQTIIQELGGEKVDIIEYSDNPQKFITNSLSPAKIISVDINNETKKAIVKVLSDQQSLAIGKAGQNVRLAAKLTGWSIDVVSTVEPEIKTEDEMEVIKSTIKEKKETKEVADAIEPEIKTKKEKVEKITKEPKETKKVEKKVKKDKK